MVKKSEQYILQIIFGLKICFQRYEQQFYFDN